MSVEIPNDKRTQCLEVFVIDNPPDGGFPWLS